MDMLQLKYFRTAAEEENITRAAGKLMVSQPALSKMIKSLEDEMGAKLFDRSGRNIALNENGRIMLRYTEKILGAAEDVKKEFADRAENARGSCRFSMTAATRLLPELVPKFKEKNPEIDIICTQESRSSQNPTCDLYIYSSRNEGEGTVLLREECVLCLPKGHCLSGKSELLPEDVAMLENESFLVIQNKMPTYQLTQELCAAGGFQPHISLECDSSETIFSLIEAELGVAVLPFVTWRSSIISHNVDVAHIGDKFCRYIMLYERKGRYIGSSAKKFRSFVLDYFEEIRRQEEIWGN